MLSFVNRARKRGGSPVVITYDYNENVTANELKRKLAKLGCTFEQGTRHTQVEYQGRRSVIPRHGSVEIKTGTLKAILKQLGIRSL